MPHSDAGPAPQSAELRILVAEDEALIRHAMAEALRELGVRVVEAATADEAWEYLASGAKVDLVFTDHRMPGSMTGTELAARIKKDYPILKVVLTSAHFSAQEITGPVLRKPYPLYETAADLVQLAFANQRDKTGP